MRPSEDSQRIEQATGPMDAQAVMGMLLHRYPFLLVDRVDECLPGKHIIGVKNVSRSEPIMQRSAHAELPMLLVIEALAQVSVILTYKSLGLQPTGRELMFFAGIDDAEFVSPVRAGDRLELRSSVFKLRKTMGWFRAEASVDGKIVASMKMLAAIQLPAQSVSI